MQEQTKIQYAHTLVSLDFVFKNTHSRTKLLLMISRWGQEDIKPSTDYVTPGVTIV